MKRVYVGDLPYDASEERIRALFAQHGAVHAVRLITDLDTGRLRGFGFVDMDDASAQAAITALNDTDIDGRALIVNEARPRREQRSRPVRPW